MNKYNHIPVLNKEVINLLNIKPNGIYIDCTFGCGGHSLSILSKLDNDGRLIVIDQDPSSIFYAKNINDRRLIIIHSKFSNLKNYVNKLNLIGYIDGMILDLGISYKQLSDPLRGFSFMKNGPLDMRMNNTCGKSAAQLLARASVSDISSILKNFGEERFHYKIARAIFNQNRKKVITRTQELSKLIINNIPYYDKHKHPATRCFQAIRIYVNNELEEIKNILDDSLDILSIGGKIIVISFHSLEDKIVKNFIKKNSNKRLSILSDLPFTEIEINNNYSNKPCLKEICKIKPSKYEIKCNVHSRSAILRCAEKIDIKNR